MSNTLKTALNYLSRREHSRLELKQKLSQKDFSEVEIENTLNVLSEKNLQSDERFCESYIRYRQSAGFGPHRISEELKQRGISPSLIASHIDRYSSEWKNNLCKLTERFRNKKREQLIRFLYQRGYDYGEIRVVLDETRAASSRSNFP